MEKVKKVLVVQFDIQAGDTLERFHAIEDVLTQAFEQNNHAVVDGHDHGQDRFNIFIHPRGAWGPVIERVRAFLELKGSLNRATIAKGLASGRWQVIWPTASTREFEL